MARGSFWVEGTGAAVAVDAVIVVDVVTATGGDGVKAWKEARLEGVIRLVSESEAVAAGWCRGEEEVDITVATTHMGGGEGPAPPVAADGTDDDDDDDPDDKDEESTTSL